MIGARTSLPSLLALAILAGALAVSAPKSAAAITLFEDPESGTYFRFTGYTQPYFRWVETGCVASARDRECSDVSTPMGFGLQRTRLHFEGASNDLASYHIELRTIPNVELLEASVRFQLGDYFALRVGRYRVPYSRQELVSESRLQLIDRGSLIRFTPGRQLGSSLAFQIAPGLAFLPNAVLRIEGGVFNGESDKERAPINNIDDEFLYSARVELHPFGRPETAMEGDLRPVSERSTPMLTLGGHWTYETRGEDNENYREGRIGGDLTLAWYGAFLYGEYFRRDRDYRNDTVDIDQHAWGYNLQAGFMIPAPYLEERLELAGRVEEIHPQTARDSARSSGLVPLVPGTGPQRPDGRQATRSYVAGINWYFRGHDLKLQANYTWRQELEDWALSIPDEDGLRQPRGVDNDSFFLQLTYRF